MLEILDFLQEHKKAVIAVVIMILCILISGGIAKSFAKSNASAADSLSTVNNKISNVQDQLNQPQTRWKELDHGYHKSRVERDVKTLIGAGTGNGNTNEWLSRFLTWSSGDEYKENHQWFVEKLGSNNVFCTTIMRSYDKEISLSDSGTVNDPNNIKCELDKDKTAANVYVNSINESNDTYNYVIFAYFNAKAARANQSFDAMDKVQCYIVTVSVDADGNVLPDTFIVSAGPTSTID